MLTNDQLNMMWKLVFGRPHTSPNKQLIYNEKYYVGPPRHSEAVVADPITPTPDPTLWWNDGIVEYLKLDLEFIEGSDSVAGRHGFIAKLPADYETYSTNPNKGTWPFQNGVPLAYTNGRMQVVTDAASYSAYVFNIYDGNGDIIGPEDERAISLFEMGGIVYQGNPLEPGDSLKNPRWIDGYVYIGHTVFEQIQTIQKTLNQLTSSSSSSSSFSSSSSSSSSSFSSSSSSFSSSSSSFSSSSSSSSSFSSSSSSSSAAPFGFYTQAEAAALSRPLASMTNFALWNGPDRPYGPYGPSPFEWSPSDLNFGGVVAQYGQTASLPSWASFEWPTARAVKSIWFKAYSASYISDVSVDYWNGSSWIACGGFTRAQWEAVLSVNPSRYYAKINLSPVVYATKYRLSFSNGFSSTAAYGELHIEELDAAPMTRVCYSTRNYVDNLARYGTWTTDDQVSGPVNNLKNGTDAYWQSGKSNPWVEVDLGGVKLVTGIDMFSSYGNQYQQQIEISRWTGAAWEHVCYFFRQNNDQGMTFASPVVTQKFRFQFFNNPLSMSTGPLLSEIQIFGTSAPSSSSSSSSSFSSSSSSFSSSSSSFSSSSSSSSSSFSSSSSSSSASSFSGDFLSFQPGVNYYGSGSTYAYYNSVCRMTEDKALVAYSTAGNNSVRVRCLSLSGDTISTPELSVLVQSTPVYGVTICSLGADKALLVWINNYARLQACCLSLSGSTVSVSGSIVDVFVGTAYRPEMAGLSSSQAVLTYYVGAGAYACGLSVSGTDITVGAATLIGSSGASLSVCRVNDSLAVALYGRDSAYRARCLSVAGNAVTAETEVFVASASTWAASICRVSADKVLCVYDQGGAGRTRTLSISGVTLTPGTEVDLAGTSTSNYNLSVCMVNGDYAVASYRKTSTSYGAARVLYPTGSTVLVGSEVIFEPSAQCDYFASCGMDQFRAIAAVSRGGNYGYAYLLKLSVPSSSSSSSFSSSSSSSSSSAGAWNYFRMYGYGSPQGSTLIIAEIKVAETVGGGNVCTGGAVLASSEYPAGQGRDAFDGSVSTYWNSSVAIPQWIWYNFPTPRVIKEVKMTPLSGFSNYMPSDFYIQGSNNGTDWTTLATFTGVSWGASEQTFVVP